MIVFFTGTGNTRHCSQLLAEELGESLHELCTDELRKPANASLDIPKEEQRIIWAFPTYSWGIPPVVARYIAEVKLSIRAANATHYMLTTCGDDMAYTDRQWRRILGKRGVRAAEAFAVEMPNTYTLMKGFDVDSPEVERRKLEACGERIRHIADAIRNGKPSELIRGTFPAVKSSVIYPWFKRFAMSPKPFHANEGCISCGLCARSCPMENISMNDGLPAWGDNCALCLRCYHICPRHAVAYGNATDGKGQYMCPD